jgi:hypothetical protein
MNIIGHKSQGYCILSNFISTKDIEVNDQIIFDMPAFCSGDYTFKVSMHEQHGLILLDAPTEIFKGCRNFRIIKHE